MRSMVANLITRCLWFALMKFCKLFLSCSVGTMLGLFVPSASAVINIDLPIGKIFEAVKSVTVAKVTTIQEENRVIDLQTVTTLKGPAVGEIFRVQIVAPPDLIAKVAVGQPLILMTGDDLGKPVALIHLANTWLLAEMLPTSKVPAWRVIQAHDAKKSFPGTTEDLVKVLGAIPPPKSAPIGNSSR